MISVFDTNPVTFEDKGRTLTISYNGVLCKNANGQIITDIDFEDVNELFLTRYLNSNSNYTIRFRDHNWKSIEGQDLDTDRTESNAGHNIRETKAIIAAFARNKLTAEFPANLDTLQLPLDYSYMGKREITIKNGVISNGKIDIPINEIRRVICASNGTISKLLVYKEEKPSSFFKKIFDKCDMKITLNAITLPLLEAIVTQVMVSTSVVVTGLIKRILTISSFATLTLGSSLKKTVQHLQNGRKQLLKQPLNLTMM